LIEFGVGSGVAVAGGGKLESRVEG